MKKTNAFTLIELLVVIAIIGLLLAIITPALKRAKAYGQRVVCANNLKSIGTANQLYTGDYNGAYIPIAYRKPGSTTRIDWIRNEAFRSYMDFDAFLGSEEGQYYDLPDELLCPADKIGKDLSNAVSGVLTSYAYNVTDWGWEPLVDSTVTYVGHKVSNLKQPAIRLAFTDSIDWWLDWAYADYAAPGGWDEHGQDTITYYHSVNLWAPTIYRHSEGVNIGYYDGHVEYQPKEKVFIKEDWEAYPKKPGMWVVDLELFRRRY